MIQFQYDGLMKRYNVLVPFVLAGESSDVTVASISEDKESKITLHRELSIKLLRQIFLSWDEKVHMDTVRAERETGEFDRYFDDKPKNKKKGDK